MNDDSSKLRHQHEQSSSLRKQSGSGPMEFSNAEELLRNDVRRTMPPAAIIERLNRSLAEEPLPRRSWWQRLFSR